MNEGWDGTGVHPVKWLRDHGWTQRFEADGKGRVCLYGAILNTSFNGFEDVHGRLAPIEEIDRIKDAIREIDPDAYYIPDFNDNKDRTQEEVELVLLKTYGEPLSL